MNAGPPNTASSRRRSAALRGAADAPPLGRRTKGLAGMVIPASLAGGGGERWQAPPAGWRRGAGHPWPGVRIERGARSGRGSGVRVADRPVVGGWSALESAGRERGARSGRGRGSLSRGGKEAGGWWGSGRCGKGAPIGWMAVRKRSVPVGERPSVLAGAGGVTGVGAGGGDGQAVGQSTLLAMPPAAGNPQAVGRPNRSPRWNSADEGNCLGRH